MQVATFFDPFALVDHNAMHHSDLTGRPTEAVDPDVPPRAQRLTQARCQSRRFHRHTFPSPKTASECTPA